MENIVRAGDMIKSFRFGLLAAQDTRLSGLRSPMEFFDYNRFARPAGLDQAASRISYNTRYFSGNYSLLVAVLAVYAILTNPLLLLSLAFLVGGFAAIGKFVTEPVEIAGYTLTQKNLYTTLFVIGIPLLFLSSPLGTFFWLVGASAFLILTHACLMEPGIESSYAAVDEAV